MTPQHPVDGASGDRFEELLRSAMHEEAETVVPRGDGLSKIQSEVVGRRSRQRWLRPLLALGSAVAVMAVGVGVYAVTNGGDNKAEVFVDPTETPTSEPTTVSPSPSDVLVPSEDFPAYAIFPFSSAADADNWQKAYADGHQPWVADPRAVAEAWVQNYLQVPAIDTFVSKKTDGATADVTLGRTMTAEAKRLVPVTVVHLVQYGDAWIVTGADDPAAAPYTLKVTAPAPGDEVSSPVTVSGPGFGADEAAELQVRDATTPTKLGVGHVSWGDQPEWSSTVDFDTPPHDTGVVVVREDSAADGGPQRLTAVQVRFGAVSEPATAPSYFYGVKNGRVTKFSARTGAAIDYITPEEPGGGASDPQLVRDTGTIYFLRGGGSCVNSIAAVPASGGDPVDYATPNSGYVIQSFVVGDGAVTYYEVACSPDRSPQAKLVTVVRDGTSPDHPIRFESVPPGIEGDLAVVNRFDRVAAFVRTGTQGYLAKYDVYDDTSTPSRNACSGYDVNQGLPVGITSVGSTLWFAADTGSAIDVIRCSSGGADVAFTIPSGRGPADVAVTGDGAHVLVSDDAGRVWRWDGDGAPQQLTDLSVPLDHITW
jgi:hypothetical protein